MTSVILNSKKISKSLPAEKTLSDLYDYIMSEYANPDEVFSKILVDGKIYSDDEEKELFNKKIETYKTIEFDLKNKYDLAFEAIDCSTELVDSVISKIQKSIGYYQCNNIDSGNILFSQIVESLDLFVQLLSNVHHTLRTKYEHALKSNKTFHQLEIHLLSIIKAMVPAKERNDLVMLCDLLEYELVDNLTQWKISAIPELKSIQNNS